MNEYRTITDPKEILDLFKSLGINIWNSSDPGIIKRNYGGWKWTVRKCDDFPIILNALSPAVKSDFFWEEWFIKDDEVHHHLLSLTEPESFDEVFPAPEADDIHPPETLGKKWFVLVDHDLQPLGLRDSDSFSSLWVTSERHVEYLRAAVPQPQPDEVVIKIKSCGICGTDLHFFNDLPENKPTPLGHELSGVVHQKGDQVKHLEIGDDVVIQNHIPCGSCTSCLNRKPEKCRNIQSYMNSQAGLGELLLVPASMAIPYSGLDYAQATLAEPVTVSLDLIDRAVIRPGDSVLIAGPGIIGLSCIPLALKSGASSVAVSAYINNNLRSIHRTETALKMGASYIIDTSLSDWKEQLRAKNPEGFDKIIVTAPPNVIPEYLDFLGFGGDLIYNGISFRDDHICIGANALHFNKNSIISSHATPNWGFPQAIDLLKKGVIDPDKLISARIPYRKAVEGILINLDKSRACIKAVIEI